MLKLLKHDIRDSYLEVVVFCGVLLLTSLFIMFSIMTQIGFWIVISWLAYSAAGLALSVVVLKVIVQNFHIKLFASGGYLTLTTPISINKILLSKILVSMLWLLLLTLTFIASIFVVLGAFEFMGEFLVGLFRVFMRYPLRVFQIGLVFLASALSGIVTLLLVLSLSNIGRSKKAKVLKGILIYYGLTQVMSIISVIIMMSLMPALDRSNLSGTAIFYVITSVIFIIFIGWSIGFYFLSKYLIIKKVELE
ncbi:MAG: hypothetical protein FWE03_07400 [Firmicutes bacterium]|nr:hypothetical protein [Bacillota bacterium]